LQNQNTLRRANLFIVASKYQLLKMQEDIKTWQTPLQKYSIRKPKSAKKAQLGIDEKQLSRSQELVNAGTIPKGDLFDVSYFS
jgi:outer membrane protein